MKCPACQQENPNGQKFCGNCGTNLRLVDPTSALAEPGAYTPHYLAERILGSRSAMEGERKLVTVVFCDIAGSTELASAIGADAMHALLNRFFETALAEVHRFEGTINQFLGDGFMALFGAPLALEDHGRRALLAALAVRRAVAGSDQPDLARLRLRIGINTGVVIVGRIGDNLRMDYTAVGDTTHLAARLEHSALPGTIRVSEATRRVASRWFEFKPLGAQTFKGIPEPQTVHELIAERSARTGPDEGAFGVPLVGRVSELAQLRAVLAELGQGQGSIAVLTGEPGVGKSRLLAEVRHSAEAEAVRWLEGRSISFGRTFSYWPFIEVLREQFGIVETDAEAIALQRLEAGCNDLFGERAPELIPYLGTVLGLNLPEAHNARVRYLDPQAMGRQVFLSMRTLFSKLARRQPLVIVMEDWHWVDQSSIALCEHLLSLARTEPLSFWFASRPEPAASLTRVRQAIAKWDPPARVTEIALPALPNEDSMQLLSRLLGGSPLPSQLEATILRRTDGNPFFLEEMVQALITEGALVRSSHDEGYRLARPVEELILPDTVQAILIARIDRLDDEVKSVLKLASVIGRTFFIRILGAVSEAGENLEHDLGELEQAEFIRLRQQVPELEFIFKHALVQEATYGSIILERRKAIHRSVVRAIETIFSDRLDEFVATLAYHSAQAEDWDKAQEYLFRAGDQAGRMAADAEALDHYRAAEAAYVKASGRPLSSLERAILDRKLGQAFYGAGDYQQAVTQLTRSLAHLRVRYPQTKAGVQRATLRYLGRHLMRRLMRRFRPQQKPTMDLTVGQEIAANCAALQWLDFFVDEDRLVLDILIELDAGERCDDVPSTAFSLAGVCVVLMTVGLFGLARRFVIAASALAQACRNPSAIAEAALALGWLEWMLGHLELGAEALLKSCASHEVAGDVRRREAAESLLSVIAVQAGHLSEATRLAMKIIRDSEAAGDPLASTWGLENLAIAELIRGSPNTAVTLLERSIAICVKVTSYRLEALARGVLAGVLLHQGDLEAATRSAEHAVRIIRDNHLRGYHGAFAWVAAAECRLAEVEALTGADRTAALLRAEKACADLVRSVRAVNPWKPEALRLYGRLAWLSDDRRTARTRWTRSLALATQYGMPIERGRTLLEIGRSLGESAAVEEAIDIFVGTGARLYWASALHARAALVAQSRGSSAATSLYAEAISALESVGAGRELAIARAAVSSGAAVAA